MCSANCAAGTNVLIARDEIQRSFRVVRSLVSLPVFSTARGSISSIFTSPSALPEVGDLGELFGETDGVVGPAHDGFHSGKVRDFSIGGR